MAAGTARTARRRSPLAEWPTGLVLTGVGLGLAVVSADYFRRGATIVAVAVCLGALLRMALPVRRCGLLAVRSRAFDVFCLLVLGVGILVLALVVPPST